MKKSFEKQTLVPAESSRPWTFCRGLPLAALLVATIVSLAACNKSGPADPNHADAPSAVDAQAAARQLVERILGDYASAGETDPIGFLARRDDVDSTVVSTLQHTMSLDPRDPLRCDAKSVRDYHFENAKSVSPTRWIIGMLTAANTRDSFTVELGADGKWRLTDINCA